MKYTDLIFDVGGVLITYTVLSTVEINDTLFQRVFKSDIFYDFERGTVSEKQFLEKIGAEFDISESSWKEFSVGCASSVTVNKILLEYIAELKSTFPALRIHIFSNISKDHWELLKAVLDSKSALDWRLFGEIVTSFEIGSRKPEKDAYSIMLERISSQPESCVFVDDTLKNIVMARSLGWRSILMEDTEKTISQIKEALSSK